MCTKKHIPRKELANSKNGGINKQKTNQQNKKKNEHFFNSVCKHFIKIEILTLHSIS